MSGITPANIAADTDNTQIRPRKPWLPLFILGAGIAGLWLLARPYAGIWHDGILYAGQALRILFPQEFAKDIFFLYGAQDSYSIFPPAYAWAISLLGLERASMLGTIVFSALFLCASYFLFRRILPQRLVWAGLASLAAFDHFYGPDRIFSFAELFFTARNVAEPLLIAALALLYRERIVAALFLFALAGSIHPLITLPAIVVGWIWLSLRNPRWWWAALLGLIPVVLGVLNVKPFTALFQSYDAEWLTVIADTHNYVFLKNWGPKDWLPVIFDFFILSCAALVFDKNARKLCLSVMLAALSCLASVFLFADVLNNVLATQLQLWRANWLLHYFSLVMLPFIVVSAYRSSRPGIYAAFLFIAAACTPEYPGSVVALILGALFWFVGRKNPTFRAGKNVEYSMLFAFIALLALIGFINLHQSLTHIDGFFQFVRTLFFSPVVALAAAGSLFFFFQRQKWGATGITAAALCILGIAGWDVSSPMKKTIDSGMSDTQQIFRQHMAPEETIFWERGDIAAPWLLLQRSSYVSGAQGSGLLFNRDTALEFQRRDQSLKGITLQDRMCEAMNGIMGTEGCDYNIDGVRDVCEQAKGLDFLVLRQKYPGLFEAEWQVETDRKKGMHISFYLYRCQRLLDSTAEKSAPSSVSFVP